MDNKTPERNFFHYLFKYKRSVFVFTGIITILSFIAASGIKFKEDILDLLPADDPVISQYKKILSAFKFIDMMSVDIGYNEDWAGASKDDLIGAADDFAGILSKSKHFNRVVYRHDMQDIAETVNFFDSSKYLFLNEEDYRKIDDRITSVSLDRIFAGWKKTLSETPQPGISAQLIRDPLGIDGLLLQKLNAVKYTGSNLKIENGRVFSEDMKHILIMAKPIYTSTDSEHAVRIVRFMEQNLKEISAKYGNRIRISYLSGHRFAYENSIRIKRDLKIIILLSCIFIIVLCMLTFSRPFLMLLTFIPAFLGGAVSAGLIRWLTPDISAISLGCGIIILGISVDYGIHFIYHVDHPEVTSSRENFIAAIKKIAIPLILCAGTTVMAFIALRLSVLPIYKDLAVFATTGVTASLIFSILILPLVIPIDVKRKPVSPVIDLAAYFPAFFRWIKESRLMAVIIIVFFNIAALYGLSIMETDGDFKKLNYIPPQMQKDWDTIIDNFGEIMGASNLAVCGGTYNETLEKNDKLYKILLSLQNSGLIKSFSSLAPIFPSEKIQKENITRWKEFWTDGKVNRLKKELASVSDKYRMRHEFFNPFLESLNVNPSCIDPANYKSKLLEEISNAQIAKYKDEYMILTTVKLNNPKEYNKLIDSVQREMPDVITFNGSYMMSHIVKLIYSEFKKLSFAVVILAVFFLILATRRIKMIAAIILTLLLNLLWTFGLLGLLGIKLNLINSIIVIFIFGLVFDYCIFMAKAWESTDDPEDHYLSRSGGAIAISGLTTLAGFVGLAFAQYPPFHSLGLTVAIGIISGMVSVYLVIPLFRLKK